MAIFTATVAVKIATWLCLRLAVNIATAFVKLSVPLLSGAFHNYAHNCQIN